MLASITGTWRGAYVYTNPDARVREVIVPFTLTLKAGWLGRFSGTVAEDESRGMPGTGAIKGRLSYPRLSFTKKMPVCYVTSPDGRSISFRTFLIENGIECERDYRHPPIYYEGMFSSPTQASGGWELRDTTFVVGNGLPVPMPGSKGTWKMELEF